LNNINLPEIGKRSKSHGAVDDVATNHASVLPCCHTARRRLDKKKIFGAVHTKLK